MTDDRLAKQRAAIEQARAMLAAEEKRKAEAEELKEDITDVPAELAEAVPDVFDEDKGYIKDRAEQREREDSYLKRLNILAMYKKLTGHDAKRSGGQNEKLVFCPSASHHNTNSEAACINTVKKTWVCYGQCDDGGGVIDMVAAANNMPFGKQLKGKDYAQAKQLVLEKYCGWKFEKTAQGWVGKSPEEQEAEVKAFEKDYGTLPPLPEEDDDEEGDSSDDDDNLPTLGKVKIKQPTRGYQPKTVIEGPGPVLESSHPHLAPVPSPEPIEDDADGSGPLEKLPELDDIWKYIPEGTPLYEFMVAVEEMPVPKEFSLFRGLQLLSLSAGPYVRGKVGRIFKTTLSVLFVGSSGAGKSQSRGAMNQVLDHVCYKWIPVPPNGTKYGIHSGVKRLIEPGSGEFLLQELSTEQNENGNYKIADVMADLEVDELSRFMGKGNVTGSSLVGVFQEMDNDPTLDSEVRAGSRSGGVVIAKNPNMVFSAGVQPNALKHLVGRQNISNGLLARFEIVTGNRIISDDPFESKIKDITRAQELYTDLVVYYAGKTDPDSKGVRKLFVIDVDRSARDAMKRSYRYVEELKEDQDIKSRFDLKLFKLATLFAINRKADLVMQEDVEAAHWLMEYLNRSSTLTAEKVAQVEGNAMDDAILKWSLYWTEKQGYVTRGKIDNKIDVKKNGWDNAVVSKRIEALIDSGYLLVDPRSGKRGPASRRLVHPDGISRADLKVIKQGQEPSRSRS